MFGKNEVASPMYKSNGDLFVHSVFATLQGEGPDAGRPAVFVRLARCNLRCFFCDTEFENGAVENTVDQLVARILAADIACKSVVITGGEPLLQNLTPLISYLNFHHKISVAIETAGTLGAALPLDSYFNPHRTQYNNLIVCSPKTPRLYEGIIQSVGAWKYILRVGETSDVDGLPICSTQRQGEPAKLFRPPENHPAEIFVQACDEQDPAKNMANLTHARDIALKYGYRLSVQIHKLAGLP